MEDALEKIDEKYDLELEKVISNIKKSKAKLVLLQFPDGLKLSATSIVDYLQEKTDAEFLIWFGSCFGACDVPVGLEKIKPQIDLIIQFGHNELMPSY
jgi:2-(3-amino-3-carboxypropyl)histidine synthase